MSERPQPHFEIGDYVYAKDGTEGTVIGTEFHRITDKWFYEVEYEYVDDDGEKDTDSDLFVQSDLQQFRPFKK